MMFEGKERLLLNQDWITIMFIVSLFLIALAYTFYADRFKKLFTLFYSDKYYSDYATSKPLIFNFFHVLLFPVFIFNISLLIFILLKALNLIDYNLNFINYLGVVSLVITLVFIRLAAGMIIGVVLDIYDQQRYATLLKISNLVLSGFYLLPLMVLVVYTPVSMRNYLVYTVAVVMFFFLIFRYISLIRNERVNFNTLFYLILYLCALEIAPFIISYKLFVK